MTIFWNIHIAFPVHYFLMICYGMVHVLYGTVYTMNNKVWCGLLWCGMIPTMYGKGWYCTWYLQCMVRCGVVHCTYNIW